MKTPGYDPATPNVARIYDYLLGGKDNFASDREAADRITRLIPDAADACRQNRYFLHRVVQYLVADAGIRQIIDIGAGLPTQGNVHEVAQNIDRSTRVIYADYDPVVASHARALLVENPNVAFAEVDLRDPDSIFVNPDVPELIDFQQPVAILMFAILHFITDDEGPYEIVDRFKARMAPNSYLALSHITDDAVSDEDSKAAQKVYQDASAPVTPRSHEAVEKFFDGMELTSPGLVDINGWPVAIPDYAVPMTRQLIYGGVGHKTSRGANPYG